MKSSSFDSMIIQSAALRELRAFKGDLIDRSQLKSSELASHTPKVNVLAAIKNIVRFRKSKKSLLN